MCADTIIEHFEKNKNIKKKKAKKARNYSKEVSKSYFILSTYQCHNMPWYHAEFRWIKNDEMSLMNKCNCVHTSAYSKQEKDFSNKHNLWSIQQWVPVDLVSQIKVTFEFSTSNQSVFFIHYFANWKKNILILFYHIHVLNN